MPPSYMTGAAELRSANEMVLPPLAADVSRDETNHRLANSLQLLSALVAVQSRGVTDPTARTALETTQHQIAAIANVHRHLYQMDDSRSIELAEYLRGLGRTLSEGMGSGPVPREVRVIARPGRVSAEHASAVGVIVTELVVNACKHAYAPDQPGGVEVRLHWPTTDSFWLQVADQGKGRDPAATIADTGGSGGMGSRIVELMVRKLGGEYSYVDSAKGTCFAMLCPAGLEY